jgi:hypothetical protein
LSPGFSPERGKGDVVKLLKNQYSFGEFPHSWIYPQLDVLSPLPSHRRERVRVRLAI